MKTFITLTSAFAATQASNYGVPTLGGYGSSALAYGPGYAAGPIGYGAGPIGYGAGPIGYGAGLGGYRAGPYAYGSAPYAYGPAPVIIKKPIIPTLANQYQVQDNIGNAKFGYSNINQAQREVSSAYGGKVGSYSYVDPNGETQTVEYVADAAGFRIISATNLPVAPEVPEVEPLVAPVDTGVAPVDTGVAPEPVIVTPEIAAATAEHLAAVAAAENGHRRRRSLGYGSPLIGAGYGSGLLGAGYGSPLIGAGLGSRLIGGYGTYGGYGYGSPLIGGYGLGARAIIAKPVQVSGYSSTTINPVEGAALPYTLASPFGASPYLY